MADSHLHTLHSHDSTCALEEHCNAAIENGVSVIAITDHCDVSFCRWESNCDNVLRSADEARLMNEKMGERLTVVAGVELGDGAWNPKLVRYVAEYSGFDVILGSVHTVAYKNYGMPFSAVNFGVWNHEEIRGFMGEYFDDIEAMMDVYDFNVLSHLTVPLRYINGKYCQGFPMECFDERIEKILRRIIDRGIALEVNTSAFAALGTPMPDKKVIQTYKALGGKLITLGSDAHVAINLGSGFKRTLELLKECGFDSYFYMKDKKFVPVDII